MTQPSPVPHMTAQQFRTAGHDIVDWIATYLETVEQRPVRANVAPGDILAALPLNPPTHGEPFSDIWNDFQNIIMPGVTHWQHPSFAAFFPCNNSHPSILAELLSAGLGINGFLWQCSPAITELEMRVMDWLAIMLDLPKPFHFSHDGPHASGGGVIQGTASEAVLTAIVAARSRIATTGSATPRLIAYTSSQAHSSVIKAAMVSGIGRENVRLVDVDNALALNPEALNTAIAQDRAQGLTPFFICATVGTTSTGAIDPLPAIGAISRHEGTWLHVDAAYAGAACICPEHRHLIDGVEHADSFNFNPHKWLLTNFDCSAFWTSDRASLNAALSITPAYLRNQASDSGSVIDYRDWQVPLGRRFRALKLWFVLRHYGVEGLRAHIRHHVALAQLFESLVRADPRFEIPTPTCLSLVCFRLKGTNADNQQLVERINATNKLWLTPTQVPLDSASTDQTLIRMAIGATTTTERHVRDMWHHIRAAADTIPSSRS